MSRRASQLYRKACARLSARAQQIIADKYYDVLSEGEERVGVQDLLTGYDISHKTLMVIVAKHYDMDDIQRLRERNKRLRAEHVLYRKTSNPCFILER